MRYMGLRFPTVLFLAFLTLSVPASMMLPGAARAEEEVVYITEDVAHDALPAAEASTEEHHGEAVGFPQLKTDTYATQVFWLFVSFFALFFLMWKKALPAVGQVIERRQEQRHSDLDNAQRMQEESQKIKGAFEIQLVQAQTEAQKEINAAIADTAEKSNAEAARFAENAQKRAATAEQSITRAKLDAQQSIVDVVSEISADIVNKIAGTQLTKAEAKRAVTTAIQKEGQA